MLIIQIIQIIMKFITLSDGPWGYLYKHLINIRRPKITPIIVYIVIDSKTSVLLCFGIW